MIKNIKFSFIKTLLILGVFVVLIGSLLMMQVKDTSAESSPEVVLNKYLTAHKNKDIEEITKLCNDNRVESKKEQKEFLTEVFTRIEEDLKSFEVLNFVKQEKNIAYVKARVEYNHGKIEEMAFKLKKENNSWIVNVSGDMPMKEEYKLVRKSDIEEYNGGRYQFEGEKLEDFNAYPVNE